jgi:trans-aconitate 2-methyltransferase
MNDWDARDYAAYSSAQLGWARELIDKLRLLGDEDVLDIGCGDGRATALIAERLPGGSVLGIDNSASMIALAEEQFPPPSTAAAAPSASPAGPAASLSAYSNLRFRRMDAARLELPRSFDVAFSNAALHWVEDHEAMLRGVRACLRPAGRLLFQMGGRGNAAQVRDVVEELVARPRWRGSFRGFSSPYRFCGPDDYDAWLPRAGFRVTRAVLVDKDMQHAEDEAFRGWLRTTWFPYMDRLPEERRGDFLDELAAAYSAAHPADDQGVIHVRMVRLEVEAEVA